jgi:hypothetical protein
MEGDRIIKQERESVGIIQLDNEEGIGVSFTLKQSNCCVEGSDCTVEIGSSYPDERFETNVEVNDSKGVTISQVSDRTLWTLFFP